VDEAAAVPAMLGYYRAVRRAAEPGTVVLNPGTVPAPGYLRVADVIVDFEGPWTTYRTARFPAWTRREGARFAHLVYAAAAADLPAAVALAGRRRAAWLYVTEAALPNPWGAPPSYLPAERAAVRGLC
jgi:hypothetical protein